MPVCRTCVARGARIYTPRPPPPPPPSRRRAFVVCGGSSGGGGSAGGTLTNAAVGCRGDGPGGCGDDGEKLARPPRLISAGRPGG